MSEPAATSSAPSPGCLTDGQIAELQAAPPGGAPEALARHLASCERCQARALFGAERRPPKASRAVPEPPSIGRAVLLAALVLAAMGVFFWTLLKLAGRID
jgi:hypothetical protein